MSKTLINLDAQAKARIFSFGTASANEQANVTLFRGTAATGTTVLTVQGSVTVGGNISVAVAPSANDHAVNKLFVDNLVSGINSNITTLSADTATLKTGTTQLSGRTTTLETGATQLSGRTTTLETGTTQLSGRTTTLETGTTQLSGRTNTLESNVTTISGNVTTNTTNIAALSGASSTLAGRVTTNENNIVTLTGTTVPNINASITTITGTTIPTAQTAAINASTGYTKTNVIDQKGVANGYAPLNASVKIDESFLPDSIVGQVEYKGVWDAATNTPTLGAAGAANKGHYYVASTSGTQFTISFEIGDWIISNGSTWAKVDNSDAVATVHGRMGNVVGVKGDYSAELVTITGVSTIASDNVKGAIEELVSDIAGVTSANNTAISALGGDALIYSGSALHVVVSGTGGLQISSDSLRIKDGSVTNAMLAGTIAPSKIATDASNRFVTDAEKGIWNGKENAITIGTTLQYWRGDKTFQTLNTTVVPEGTNVYHTNGRAIGATLTAYAKAGSSIPVAATDTVLGAIQKLEGQIDNVSATAKITKKLTITAGTGNTYNVAQTFVTGSLQVYVNGLLMSSESGDDYTVAGQVVTFNYALEAGDKVIAYGAN
jgi:X-X-X-Leu-X-X-Gly heptad repeat protein